LITVFDCYDQINTKSPGSGFGKDLNSGSGEDFKAIEVNNSRCNNQDWISNSMVGVSRSTTSDSSHVQGFFPGKPGENIASSEIGHYQQQIHAFLSQQQTVGDQLSDTYPSGNQLYMPTTVVRLPSNYQNPNSFLPNHSQQSLWSASNPFCSPNLALNNQSVHNNSLPFGSFQNTLHLPANLNVAYTPNMLQSPSIQPHQVLGDAIQAPRRDSRVRTQRNLNSSIREN
jgi:hypothetical protein